MMALQDIAPELTATGAPISALFISFLAFSFIGWLYESTVCALANSRALREQRIPPRPVLPHLRSRRARVLAAAAQHTQRHGTVPAAALLCSMIEYSVGALLEHLTGARLGLLRVSP